MTSVHGATVPPPPVARRRLLRLGVLGLGTRWQRRYAPVLERLRDLFSLRLVCDPSAERSEQEARRLGCAVAAGPAELLEPADIDALLLLETPWYGLWPVELACRRGLPVFCAAALAQDGVHAEALVQLVRDSGVAVTSAATVSLAPTAARLTEVLAHEVGPARSLICTWSQRRRTTSRAALLGNAGGALLQWCVSLLGGEPVRVHAVEAGRAGLACVLIELRDGRAVHLIRQHSDRNGLRVEAVGQRGRVWADWPRHIGWTTAAGRQLQVLPRPRPGIEALLRAFYQTVVEGKAPCPGLADAARALSWLRAIERSRHEQCSVPLDEPPSKGLGHAGAHPPGAPSSSCKPG